MMKVLTIGWKDLLLTLRDRTALILMLAAPFVLTLAMGFVSGRFSGAGGSGLSEIAVVIVNQDDGPLGTALVEVFASDELADLVAPTLALDAAAARQPIDDDTAAAAIIIPAGFSDSILPNPAPGQAGALAAIEVYANPARPVGSGVARSIVERFLSQVETGRVGGQVTVAQLVESGRLSPQEAASAALALGQQAAANQESQPAITVRSAAPEAGDAGDAQAFDSLAFFAPGMAMLFLMFTVTNGGRSLLAERDHGTLARLMSTPTHEAQVLGGKVFGIFLNGAAQVGVLVLASSVLFGLRWGDPLAVVVLVLAIAAGATGWGLLLTSFARTPAQVSSVGSAMMLLFGILSGTFIPSGAFPDWFQWLSRITPNAWGLLGFTRLGSGGGLADIAGPVAALLVMALALFTAAVILFRRSGALQR